MHGCSPHLDRIPRLRARLAAIGERLRHDGAVQQGSVAPQEGVGSAVRVCHGRNAVSVCDGAVASGSVSWARTWF